MPRRRPGLRRPPCRVPGMPLRLPRRLPGVQQPSQLAVALIHAVVLKEWPAQDDATASSCCSGSAEASNLLPWRRGGSGGPLVPRQKSRVREKHGTVRDRLAEQPMTLVSAKEQRPWLSACGPPHKLDLFLRTGAASRSFIAA
jgi:hypothetical protein